MSSPFVRQLAASDRKTRDDAVNSLTKLLSSSRTFTELELLKLWKGLFFCFWHSDRTMVQQALASDLAALCLSVQSHNFVPFVTAYWTTMCREWNSIDILRLDKFYTLVRKYIAASFQRLHSTTWNHDLVEEYIGVLEHLPLSPKDQKVPNGIRYHLADIYLEELGKVVPDEERSDVPIETLVRPFEQLILHSPTKSVRLRVMKRVFDDPLLESFGYEQSEDESDLEEMDQDEDSETPADDGGGEEEEEEEEEKTVLQDDDLSDDDGGSDAEFAGFD